MLIIEVLFIAIISAPTVQLLLDLFENQACHTFRDSSELDLVKLRGFEGLGASLGVSGITKHISCQFRLLKPNLKSYISISLITAIV